MKIKFSLIAFAFASLVSVNVFAQDEFAEMVNEYREDGEVDTYLKLTSWDFKEGREDHFGAFIKFESEDLKLQRMTFFACGIKISNLKGKNFKGILDTHKKVQHGNLPPQYIPNVGTLEFDGKPLLGREVKYAKIIFEEGSAEKCKDYPHKYFLFDFKDENGSTVKYRMKFDIVGEKDKKDNSGEDGSVKVLKTAYDKVKSVCDGIDMKTLNTVRGLTIASASTSAIGAGANLAGVVMGGLSIANNKNNENKDLNKKLDIGQTVTSSIGLASGGASLGTSSVAAVKIKKLISDIEACKKAVRELGIISD